MLYILLIILGSLTILGVSALISMFIYGYLQNKPVPIKNITQKVTVIVPCKGLVSNLENNLLAICSQSRIRYQVIFVLDSDKDPAYTLINTIVQKIPYASLVFAQKISTASGKISALIEGIKHCEEAEIYVFADSDILPHTTWLVNLVAPLNANNIGATTGFRWYFPIDLKTSLIAAWNMATIPALYHQISNYTWGGSTAIKKSLFDRLGIENKWRTGFSDDLILTQVVKKAGYTIKFVPQSIVESPEDTDISTFLKWGTQQFAWMRWYTPFTYYFTLIGFLFLQVNIVLGIAALGLGYTIPGILMISTIFLEMIYGATGIYTLRRVMKYPKEKFGKTSLYILLMPLAFLFFTYNYLISSVKTEIKWGDRLYRKTDI